MFVWPWIEIFDDFPTEYKDGRYMEESGTKLKDQLTRRGINPIRVQPLLNYQVHSGTSLVECIKDWYGFNNANVLYRWVAQVDDYNSDTIFGENLRNISDLRWKAKLGR
ncbi:Protein INVOLVED IN DE NOVO 2 [Forsythia ovata]|uniref:Protein INVOLVED IN DE NOVO 2 n=1 Tax=Forsythia ovata TaxID=205694 RepID=A0ABD1PKP6_9LAMI